MKAFDIWCRNLAVIFYTHTKSALVLMKVVVVTVVIVELAEVVVEVLVKVVF